MPKARGMPTYNQKMISRTGDVVLRCSMMDLQLFGGQRGLGHVELIGAHVVLRRYRAHDELADEAHDKQGGHNVHGLGVRLRWRHDMVDLKIERAYGRARKV